MERTASVDQTEYSTLKFCCYLPDAAEYDTMASVFTAGNCIKEWALAGKFAFLGRVFHKGKEVASLRTPFKDEKGFLKIDFSDLARLSENRLSKIAIIEVFYSSPIPLEVYCACTHRKTGSYAAFPASTFIGDQLTPDWHATEMESTLFWPGVVMSRESEASVAIMNPFDVGFQYQLSLFLADGSRHISPVRKVGAYGCNLHSIEEIFPEQSKLLLESGGQASICAAAQYKLVAYYLIKSKITGAYTTIDHLHPYTLV